MATHVSDFLERKPHQQFRLCQSPKTCAPKDLSMGVERTIKGNVSRFADIAPSGSRPEELTQSGRS
jgi:hypothetical protein